MSAPSLNWDDLKVFLAVARAGTLSAAARVLGVSQPTVSRRLAALEADLNNRLFDRLPDGFVPTQAGMELQPLAEAMEQAADAVGRRGAALADRVSGTVRISCYELIAQFLTDQMPTLRRRLPDVEFELSVAHIGANLSKREADLLIRECLPDVPGLIARKLGHFAYAIYGATSALPQMPAAHGEARFRDCDWVSYDEDHNYFAGARWLLDRLGNRQPVVRVNNGIVLHDLVRNGVGLGILPCFAGDADPALTRLTPPIEQVETELHLIVHDDLRRVPSIRAVIDEIASLFRQQTGPLLGKQADAA